MRKATVGRVTIESPKWFYFVTLHVGEAKVNLWPDEARRLHKLLGVAIAEKKK